MRSAVRDYYGKVLKKSTDLKTNACCTINKYPQAIKNIMNNIFEDDAYTKSRICTEIEYFQQT